MVTIIEGGLHSDREELFMEKIKKSAMENKKVILIIPDQFSFEYDKTLYNYMGGKLFNKIETVGFNRLAEILANKYGESGKDNADENSKIILMYKSAKRLMQSRTAKFYGKKLNKSGFLSDMIKLISDLRESGITPEGLQIAAEKSEGSLSLKLLDISKLYGFYMEEMDKAGFKDSISSIANAVKLARDNGYFKGTEIFVNAFNSFSYDEKNMLRVCIADCSNFTISLIADHDSVNGFHNHPFTETIKTEQDIKNIAAELNKNIEFVFADRMIGQSEEITYVGKNLFNLNKKKYDFKKSCPKDVKVVSASDLYEESEYICSEIMRLVREKHYRFKDIAVNFRNLSECSGVIESICERYDIPYFIDVHNKVASSSLVLFFNSLFKCVLTKKYRTENIFKLIKSPFYPMFNYDISSLEDYCIRWNIDGDVWNSDFTACQGYTEKQVEHLNELRKKIIEPLNVFKNSCKDKTADEICRNLYQLLKDINVTKQTYSVIKRGSRGDSENQLELSRNLKQIWNMVLMAIKSIYNDMKGEKISLRQFYELFGLMLSEMTLSNPPQKADCIRICDVGHSRLSDVKVVFCAEVNDGIFPATFKSSGLITENEKKLLNNNLGIALGNNIIENYQAEKLNAYTAFAMPTEKLYALYSQSDLLGTQKRQSVLIKELISMFGDEICIDTKNLTSDFYCTSFKTAYRKYIENFNSHDVYTESIGKSIEKSNEYKEKIDYIKSRINKPAYKLSPAVAGEIFFHNNSKFVSPSAVESYYKCPFAYFCKSALKLYKTQPIKLLGADLGNIIHKLFEKIMSDPADPDKFNNAFLTMNDDEIKAHIKEQLDEYYTQVIGGDFGKTEVFKFLYEKLKENAFHIVTFVKEELTNSEFRPVATEYVLENDKEDILTIKISDGKKIIVTGKIDRVDEYTDDKGNKYFRIIDYKTGKNMELDFSRIYLGLNLQMFIYLNYLMKMQTNGITDEQEKELYKQAGVAYFMFGKKPKTFSGKGLDETGVIKKEKNQRLTAYKPLGYVVDDIKSAYSKCDDYAPFKKDNGIVTDKVMTALRDFADNKIKEFGEKLSGGFIEANPVEGVCSYCDYKNICENSFPKDAKDPKDKKYAEELMALINGIDKNKKMEDNKDNE